jgi:hypothetical protein
MGQRLIGLAAAMGAGLLLLGACGWDITTKEDTDDSRVDQRVTSVRVGNDSGSVKIRTGSETSVHRVVHYDERRPESTHRVEDGDVLVLNPCPERNCWIDYEVTVPAGTRVLGQVDSGNVELDGVASVNLKASSGNVTVRGVSGQVTVEANSGSVRLSDIGDVVTVRADSGGVTIDKARAAITVQAQSGNVEAHGVGGAADVESESGNVSVQLTAAQNVRARASSGGITVTVPRDSYKVQTNADSGDVTNDVANDANGAHQLDLTTDSGDIVIRYA